MTDQMPIWPEVIPLLATRCLYWEVHLSSGQLYLTEYHSWPLDASTRGVHLTYMKKGHLKIWTHFAFHTLLHWGLFYDRLISIMWYLLQAIILAFSSSVLLHLLIFIWFHLVGSLTWVLGLAWCIVHPCLCLLSQRPIHRSWNLKEGFTYLYACPYCNALRMCL